MIASQLSCYCDDTSNRLWRHQQNEDWASETRGRCVKIVVLSSFMDSLCRVRNKIMYVLSWRTVSTPTRVLFLCLFPSLLRNSGNKHKNYPFVSTETVRHLSTYIILYVSWWHQAITCSSTEILLIKSRGTPVESQSVIMLFLSVTKRITGILKFFDLKVPISRKQLTNSLALGDMDVLFKGVIFKHICYWYNDYGISLRWIPDRHPWLLLLTWINFKPSMDM